MPRKMKKNKEVWMVSLRGEAIPWALIRNETSKDTIYGCEKKGLIFDKEVK